MKKAVEYLRYSSDNQTEQSIEGQMRVCHEYAKRNDIVIVDTYIDRAMTGTNDNRKDFQRMLKDSAKQAWDYVIVYKLDRFSRNKYEMAMHKKTLKDNGVKLLSAMENIPDTPEGIILESLLEGMAEYYSAELSQKVKRGMKESRLKGNFTGGFVLYGYKVVNKKLVIDEDKAAVIRRIYTEYASGVYVKDIIEGLTRDGIYNRGKPFARNTVYNTLKNEKYGGIYRHGNEVFDNIYPRIVPENIFRIVRESIEKNHYGKHDSEMSFLLKNKVICGYCGKPVASESGTAKNRSVKRYYKCSGRKGGSDCKKATIRKDILENLVVETTLKALDNPDTINTVAERILVAREQMLKDNSVMNILEQERKELTKAIDNILSAIEKGIVTNSTKQRMEELDAKLDIVKCKIAVEESKAQSLLTKQDIVKFLRKTLRKEPKQMIKLLIRKIVLYDDKVEIHYNYVDKKGPDDFEHQVFSFYKEDMAFYVNDLKYKEQNFTLYLTVELFI